MRCQGCERSERHGPTVVGRQWRIPALRPPVSEDNHPGVPPPCNTVDSVAAAEIVPRDYGHAAKNGLQTEKKPL